MATIERLHVPVAIELVIDIATDIYKPGHTGRILTLKNMKKSQLAHEKICDSSTIMNLRTRATLAREKLPGCPPR